MNSEEFHHFIFLWNPPIRNPSPIVFAPVIHRSLYSELLTQQLTMETTQEEDQIRVKITLDRRSLKSKVKYPATFPRDSGK